MLDDIDTNLEEPTTFEQNPLGNRQRLVPRASFLARRQPAQVEVVDEATAAVRGSMIMDVLTHDEALDDHQREYTHDEALLSGQAIWLKRTAVALNSRLYRGVVRGPGVGMEALLSG